MLPDEVRNPLGIRNPRDLDLDVALSGAGQLEPTYADHAIEHALLDLHVP